MNKSLKKYLENPHFRIFCIPLKKLSELIINPQGTNELSLLLYGSNQLHNKPKLTACIMQ